MSVNISLDESQLARLFAAGVLHPSEVQCLDSASRDIVKALCLRLCQPKACRQCQNHLQCAAHWPMAQQTARVEVALPFGH